MRQRIVNANIDNEERVVQGDRLITGKYVSEITASLSNPSAELTKAKGKFLFLDVLDEQVYFQDATIPYQCRCLPFERQTHIPTLEVTLIHRMPLYANGRVELSGASKRLHFDR